MESFSLRSAHSLLALFFTALSSLSLADEGGSRWDKFQIVGNVVFSSEQLRQALIAEPDFLLATHPLSDRSDLAAVIERLLTAGYRNAGFPNPKIECVSTSDGGAEIRIDEGSRIRCAGVTITGASRIDVERLRERLTKPFPPEDSFPTFTEVGDNSSTQWIDAKGKRVGLLDPIWEQGSPANLDIEKKLTPSVKAAFKDLGWSKTKFSVSINTNANDATGELVVEISSEEGPDLIETISVVGSNVNAPNDVLAFLELKPGIAFNALELQRLSKRLWDGGRFTKHNLRFDRDENGRGRLHIELADVQGAPPLKEPISQTAEILLRARRWLSSIHERNHDLVLTFKQEAGRLRVVQSSEGMAVEFLPLEESVSNEKEARDDRTVLVIDKFQLALAQSQNPRYWRGDIAKFQGTIRLETKFSASESSDEFSRFGIAGSFDSDRPADTPLLEHVLNISPSDWLGFAYKQNVESKTEDGRLRLTRDADLLEIDAVTGEIYRWNSEHSDLKFEVGCFDRFQEAVARELNDKSNLFDRTKPITSLIQFCVSETSWKAIDDFREFAGSEKTSLDPTLRSAFEKLAAGGLLKPLDAIVQAIGHPPAGEPFSIPDDFAPSLDMKKMIGFIVAKPLLKFAPDLFAEGTWPMTVVRELSLALLDRGEHTGNVLKALLADSSNGPICDASVAYLLSLTSQKQVSAAFARNSLRKLNSESFDRDIQGLLSGKSGRWFSDVLIAVASLTPEEIDAIARVMQNDTAANILRDIHYRSTQSPFKESQWLQAGRSGLESLLEGIIRR